MQPIEPVRHYLRPCCARSEHADTTERLLALTKLLDQLDTDDQLMINSRGNPPPARPTSYQDERNKLRHAAYVSMLDLLAPSPTPPAPLLGVITEELNPVSAGAGDNVGAAP